MKLKTHKGAKWRIKVTGTGKLRRMKTGRRHLLTGKSSKSMRPKRRSAAIAPAVEERLRRLLPYQ
ncbi:MAG: 50S ribosomal protein L35 [Candidatus Omnitrophica bacterium]|nr:50S ribosomal protein L35 [Candidatus Omnitrophota bacterium]